MKGFRISDIGGMKVRVPSPVNIAELVSEREFHGRLMHFTEDQWKSTLEQLEPLERMPDETIRMSVTELPSGGGFLGVIAEECPPGDCEEVSSRREACSDLIELGYLLDKANWFRPCYCVEDEPGGLPDPPDPPEEFGPCEFQFVPVRVNLAGQVRTIMLFQCIAVEGRCRRCRLGYSMSPSGTYEIVCQCPLL